MPRKIHKLITPLIILPLMTGGLMSFVVLSSPGSELSEFITNARPVSSQTLFLGSGSAAIKIILAAFTSPGASAIALLLLYVFSIALAFKALSGLSDRIRNRSPPALAF